MRVLFAVLFFAALFCIGTVHAQGAETIMVKATWANPTGGVQADGVRVERSVNGGPWITACSAAPTVTTCTDTAQPLKATDGTWNQYKYHVIRFSTAFGTDSTQTVDWVLLTGSPLPATAATFSYTVQ